MECQRVGARCDEWQQTGCDACWRNCSIIRERTHKTHIVHIRTRTRRAHAKTNSTAYTAQFSTGLPNNCARQTYANAHPETQWSTTLDDNNGRPITINQKHDVYLHMHDIFFPCRRSFAHLRRCAGRPHRTHFWLTHAHTHIHTTSFRQQLQHFRPPDARAGRRTHTQAFAYTLRRQSPIYRSNICAALAWRRVASRSNVCSVLMCMCAYSQQHSNEIPIHGTLYGAMCAASCIELAEVV